MRETGSTRQGYRGRSPGRCGSILLLAFLIAAPTQGQEVEPNAAIWDVLTINHIVPDAWAGRCWRAYLLCQQPGHVAMHAAMVPVFDRLGNGLISPDAAKWISFGLGIAVETVGLAKSLNQCGSVGCNEPVPWGIPEWTDPIWDMGFRALGALWLGPRLNRLLPGGPK